jgi:hypothetical protein
MRFCSWRSRAAAPPPLVGLRVHLRRLSMARASAMNNSSNRARRRAWRALAVPVLSGAGLSGCGLVVAGRAPTRLERLPLVSISIFFAGRLRRDVGRPRDTGNRIKRPHGSALLALGL